MKTDMGYLILEQRWNNMKLSNEKMKKWVKYNLYKPVRNWLCYHGYDEDNIERRERFIRRLKE
jgi:hypothetical protein